MKFKWVFNSKSLVLICFLVGSICQPVVVADTTVKLKPKLCIKKKVTDFCDVSVDIQWKAEETNNHCVVNQTKNKELDCWSDSTAGMTRDQAHTKVDVVYALLSSGSDEALVSETLNVLSLKDDSQNNSRRRRHVWSLF